MSHFHTGEIEIQRRLDARDEAAAQHQACAVNALTAHVAGCPRCVAFVESYRATPRILRSATAAELPGDLAASLRRFLAERQ
jgi:hypothetical protein